MGVKHSHWYIPVGEGGACVERSQRERGGRGRGLCLRANRALQIQASIIVHDHGFFITPKANSALYVKIGVMNIINSNSARCLREHCGTEEGGELGEVPGH